MTYLLRWSFPQQLRWECTSEERVRAASAGAPLGDEWREAPSTSRCEGHVGAGSPRPHPQAAAQAAVGQGQGVRQPAERTEETQEPAASTGPSRAAAAVSADPIENPQPDSRLAAPQRPRQCRAHDHNIMRRCEHPAVPDTGRCERHQDVPEVALYSPRS